MYGYQFYQFLTSKRIKYLNDQLLLGRFESLVDIAADIFILNEDMKEELRSEGYFFVPELNQFVKVEIGKAS
ncbi:hypothetical protein [Paenibacillus pinihumi]|uniref:hypothetical protein n=1 Tax=Paenibacillus pinihumi TaxID=669462 RepID=UPI00040B4F63|nr:hypothetical protein [Paenibacillus pinihumi]